MKKLLLVAMLLTLGGCDTTNKYIDTDRGVMSYSRAYCQLGVVTNNDGINIFDENGRAITCRGYIYLTDEQAQARGFDTSTY